MNGLTQEPANESFPSDLQRGLGKEQPHLPACSLGLFHLLNCRQVQMSHLLTWLRNQSFPLI